MQNFYNCNHKTYAGAIGELRNHVTEKSRGFVDTNFIDTQLLPIQYIPETGERVEFSEKVYHFTNNNSYFQMCDITIYNNGDYFELSIDIHG